MSTSGDDGFFSRWSRRKAQARAGEPLPEPAAPVAPPVAVAAAPASVVPCEAVAAPPASGIAEASPPPTLEDTQQLTPASDFRRFVAKDVPPEVRNAAVKKLFADPHFNVMDGLDIYIDDYTKTEPIPAAMMAKMVSAQFLKLVEDPEEQPQKKAGAAASDAAPTATDDTRAPDAAAPHETHDDHADLQLQPDHDPGPEGPGSGAG
ncbi:DUF3306 domain-containing protein [Hydrogenophaga pseudoflava]|uniref:DUF3306 domain-containing protein n=1 Tax=Hydrogenophaga pseudoflava TaxID=47421 RepID=UPI0027E3DF10|nr:DUF3306 domain-containing protein [Hydrogenophaga pseudoflava]MDQ7746783.1 DUF3306 domain-containing protein [Hydrogenophaga pseudoflava]